MKKKEEKDEEIETFKINFTRELSAIADHMKVLHETENVWGVYMPKYTDHCEKIGLAHPHHHVFALDVFNEVWHPKVSEIEFLERGVILRVLYREQYDDTLIPDFVDVEINYSDPECNPARFAKELERTYVKISETIHIIGELKDTLVGWDYKLMAYEIANHFRIMFIGPNAQQLCITVFPGKVIIEHNEDTSPTSETVAEENIIEFDDIIDVKVEDILAFIPRSKNVQIW